MNRLMAAEFDHHRSEDRASNEGKKHRNGSTRKPVLAGDGHGEVTIPRDREARFDPVLIGKYQRCLPDFDDPDFDDPDFDDGCFDLGIDAVFQDGLFAADLDQGKFATGLVKLLEAIEAIA